MILFGYQQGIGLTRRGTLAADAAERYVRAVEHLRTVDHSSLLLHFAKDALSDLNVVLRDIHECEPLADQEQWDRLLSLEIEFDRRLLSFVAAFRTYVDQSEARLKRQYGKVSDQLAAFKKLAAESFDGYFEYRFLYKLRNFVQHVGFPDWSPWVDGKAHDGSIWRFFKLFEPSADPRELLAAPFDDWGAVRKDLEAMSERISIEKVASVVVARLDVIDAVTREAEAPLLRISVSMIDEAVKPVLDKGEFPLVAIEATVDGQTHLTFIVGPRTLMEQYGTKIPDGP